MLTNGQAVVAIIGVAGQLGGTLAGLLESDERVRRVVGIDVRPLNQQLTKTPFIQRDIVAPGLDAVFQAEGVTHVAHFAFVLDTLHDRELAHRIDVQGSGNVLNAAAGARVAKLVVTSSSVVFGAHADNPASIPESHVRRPHPRIQYSLDKVELEDLCAAFQREHPESGVVVLRPVTIVGPRMSNFLSRFVDRPVLVLPRGCDPLWQFVHELDGARAARAMLFNDLSGTYNLGADGSVRLSEIARQYRRRVLRLPRRLLALAAEVCWRLHWRRRSEIHGPLVDFLCYPPVLDNAKLKREAGFVFQYTSRAALDAFFRSRHPAAGAEEAR